MTFPLFYQKPALLDRVLHKDVRIKPIDKLDFARKTNSVYLAGTEFAEACKEYPIVFARLAGNQLAPVAVLGLRADENLFVSPSPGKWQARYVPAFVRRYPFVLADLQQGKQGVCLDMAFSGLNDAGGEALFAPDGRETPFLQNAIQFLNQFQAETVRTAAFCQRLTQAGVLVEMNARTDLADGSTVLLNGLQVVDEQKLLKLPDATLLEFFRAGEMSWIYAHLVSLGNLNALAEKLVALKAATAAQTASPPASA